MSAGHLVVVIPGGQAFVQRPTPARRARDAARIARILPAGRAVSVLDYDGADTTLAAIASRMAARIRELGGPVTLVGISYGGIVALEIAAHHPELVADLVLLVSAHDFSAEGHQRVQRQIECAERGDLVELVAGFAAVFRSRWLNALLELRLRMRRRRIAESLNDPAIIVRGLRALTGANLADGSRLARVRAPTLVIGGSRDQFFGGMFEDTVAQLPSATLAMFDGETHMLPIERARDVAARIARFLAR